MRRRDFLAGAAAVPLVNLPFARRQSPARVNGDRLNAQLARLDSIGRTAGGINRVAYSDADLAGRQLAIRLMKEAGVGCIITLGGDGTNRVVSKACETVPLIPISTGTNNVFSVMTEGTSAGMAAAIVAGKIVDEEKFIRSAKKIALLRNEEEVDLALVDAAVVTESFIGARALWDMERVHRLNFHIIL